MSNFVIFNEWGTTSEEVLTRQFPLHKASRDGNAEELTNLLQTKQNSVFEEDSFYGWTPAHWAAYFGKVNCLVILEFIIFLLNINFA